MKAPHLPLNCMFSRTTLSPSARISGMLLVLLPLILLAGCTGTSGDKDTSTPPPLYPQPQTVERKAGVPIPATPKIIHPDSVAKPQSFAVDRAALTTINAHPNRRQIPNELTTIPVDRSQLKTIPLGEGNPDFVLLSSTGDTIPTGVPVPAMGRVVQAVHSRPTKALPPSTKDAAIAHLLFLNVEHGMVSSFVRAVIEDQSGNIWLGTYGGVSVYNGQSFTHFSVKEGLSSNDVRAVIEDQSGNIWVGTEGGGVSVFNGESFTHYTVKEGLSNNFVWAILEDQSGNIWLGTQGGGVSVFNGESFTHYTVKEGLSHNNVFSILEDQSGNIWVGTGGGVSVFNGESFTHYTENEGLSNNFVFSIAEDQSGNIWLGTFSGASVFNGESFTHYSENEGVSHNFVWSIAEDKSGNIWLGTFGGGVSVFNGESFTHYGESEGLSHNSVLSILEDKSGNIWLGTQGGGVNLFNGESFTHYSENEGLSHNSVLSIAEDQSGNIWVGTEGGGVSVFDGESFTRYTENEGLSNNIVYSIAEDKNGNIWVGTEGGGVSVFNGESFIHYTENEGLSNNVVFSILEDQSGNIWLGTNGGVSVFNGEGFTHYTVKDGLSNNVVYSILKDQSGNIWLAHAGGGVSVFDGESFTHYSESEGLSNNTVLSIAEDQSGNIWLGTGGGGVSLFNGESFTHYTVNEGLSNNSVFSITEDKRAPLHETRVFIGTENGLSKIWLTEDETSGDAEFAFSIQNFGKQDGLKSLRFTMSAIIDSKNRAWWGTGNGLVMLDLNTLTFSDTILQPRLTQLDINEQFIDYRTISDSSDSDWDHIKFTGVQKFENYPLGLKLPYDNNHLTFHFAAIDWAAPHKIRYSYRMEGLNTNWSQPTADPVADYRNLPFGTYTLQIRAIGESGVWSEPFEYTFTILPPWWHTWWAYAIYVLLFLGGLRTFSLWRERRLRQEKEQLQVNVEERTVELKKKSEELEHSLEDLKSTQSQLIQQEKLASLGQLTAGIAHEIKNPLNFVNNFSEVSEEMIVELKEAMRRGDLEEADEIATDIGSNLKKIHAHGSRADGIVKSMLMHSRGGSGRMESTNLNELVKEYVNLSYHSMRAGKDPINVDIDLHLGENVGEVPLVAEDFSRVILNLCANALDAMRDKMTEDGGPETGETYSPKLTVRTRSEKGSVTIEIEDNGPGIPNEIKDKILQPFFTTKKGTQGTGLGLSITNDIIKAHGGELSVNTIAGQGTTFTIGLHPNNT